MAEDDKASGSGAEGEAKATEGVRYDEAVASEHIDKEREAKTAGEAGEPNIKEEIEELNEQLFRLHDMVKAQNKQIEVQNDRTANAIENNLFLEMQNTDLQNACGVLTRDLKLQEERSRELEKQRADAVSEGKRLAEEKQVAYDHIGAVESELLETRREHDALKNEKDALDITLGAIKEYLEAELGRIKQDRADMQGALDDARVLGEKYGEAEERIEFVGKSVKDAGGRLDRLKKDVGVLAQHYGELLTERRTFALAIQEIKRGLVGAMQEFSGKATDATGNYEKTKKDS